MRELVWLAVVALQVVTLAGCVGPTDGTIIRADAPHLGDIYVYTGSDGSHLTVRVESLENRTDAIGRVHEALILNWTLEWPVHQARFYFEEALDPRTGLIIQQVARCAIWFIDQSDDDGPLCWDDRALLLFGATGLPGAFGAGPFWEGQQAEGDEVAITAGGLSNSGPDQLRYDSEPTDEAGCLRLERQTNKPFLSALPQTVAAGPVVVCAQHAFPTRFHTSFLPPAFVDIDASLTAVEYVLSTSTRGASEAPRESSLAWHEPGRPLPAADWKDPLFLLGHNESLPLTLSEAHDAALEAVPEYRDLVNGEAPAMLVEYRFSSGSSSSSPPFNESQKYDLSFKLVTDSGAALAITVTKEITEHYPIPPLRNGSIEEEIRVVGSTASVMERHPTAASVSIDQRRLGDAFTRGLELTGQEYTDQPIRLSFESSGHSWSQSKAASRTDGYEIVMRYSEPGQETSGFVRSFPYVATFDGPSGALLMLHRPNGDMPY